MAFEDQKKFLWELGQFYSTSVSVDCGVWKMTMVNNDSDHGIWAIKRHHNDFCIAALILYRGLSEDKKDSSSEADEADDDTKDSSKDDDDFEFEHLNRPMLYNSRIGMWL